MKAILAVMISNALIENVVFTRLFGMYPTLNANKQYKHSVFTGMFATIVLLLSMLIMYPIGQVIENSKLTYLYTLILVLLIVCLVALVGYLANRMSKTRINIAYFLLLMIDCVVLGVLLLQAKDQLSFGASMAQAFGAGIGFLIALIVFTGVHIRIEKATISKSFQGVPILLIAAGIVSMIFMGFGGLVDGLL